MRTLLYLAWMRLSEQSTKMLYLMAKLAAGVLAWMVLSAFASPVLLSGAGDVINSSLLVGNARARSDRFPLRYIPRIQRMPGVDSITWRTMTAFFCADDRKKTVTVLGIAEYNDRRFH